MKAKSVYINWILFIVFLLLTGLFITWQVSNDIRMVSESIAMVFLCISLPARIYKLKIAQYALFFLLIILLFNVFDFSYTVVEGNVSTTYHSSRFNGIINPIVFIILIVYIIVNIDALVAFYQLLTKGSEKDQEEDKIKKIDFYYKKFSNCSDTELTGVFKMYNDYPDEAQIALKRIKSEKGIG